MTEVTTKRIVPPLLAQLKSLVTANDSLVGLMSEATVHFKTFEDVKLLAPVVADTFPNPDKVLLGLNEVMINAVEHGNLGIDHQQKEKLIQHGQWHDEVARRLSLPEYCDKTAQLHYLKTETEIVIHVTDEGDGFDYSNYTSIDPSREMHISGRGIALAQLLSFDHVEYMGKGNEVRCRTTLSHNAQSKTLPNTFMA